jgi:hypothetical protein
MPKLELMVQLSRPFQVALLAFAVLVLAWFAVLHRPGGGSSSGSSAPSVAASAGNSSAHSSAGGSGSSAGSGHIYHGPAPGVEGLTRDIKRAHEAAAKEAGSAQQSISAGAASPSTSKAKPATAQRTPSTRRGPTPGDRSAAATRSHSPSAAQGQIAAELAHGKTVLLLFWNPHSYDDDATATDTTIAAHKLGNSVAVHFARASQVNSFGSITRDIQIYQTPTLLIINHNLQVTTLTGFTDVYSIEQAVAEARG